MTQINKEKCQASSAKKDSSVRHFSHHLTRKISKAKEKNPDKMCLFIFLEIYPQRLKK